MRLYVKGVVLGYQRGLRTQNNDVSLVKMRIPVYRVSVRELADLTRTVRRLGA